MECEVGFLACDCHQDQFVCALRDFFVLKTQIKTVNDIDRTFAASFFIFLDFYSPIMQDDEFVMYNHLNHRSPPVE